MKFTKTQAAIPICFYSICLLLGIGLVILGHVRIAEGGEDATCTCISARLETVRSSNSGSARTSSSATLECNAKVSVELTAGGSKGSQDYEAGGLRDTSRALPDGCSCGSAPFSCWFASGQAWKSESDAENSNAAVLVIGYVMICVACVAIAIASILAMNSSDDDHHQPYQMEQHHQSPGYYQPEQGSGYPSTPHFAVGQPCGPGYGGYAQGGSNY